MLCFFVRFTVVRQAGTTDDGQPGGLKPGSALNECWIRQPGEAVDEQTDEDPRFEQNKQLLQSPQLVKKASLVESLGSPLVAGVMIADGLQLRPPATSSSGWCWPYNQTHDEVEEEKEEEEKERTGLDWTGSQREPRT